MKLIPKNKISESDDLPEFLHKKEKIQKRFLWLFAIIALAIILFVIYAYFIDKPEFISVTKCSDYGLLLKNVG
jgi:predicted nucleic acid-binding Zn ribbon protein